MTDTDHNPTGLNPNASELKSPANHTAYDHHDAYNNPLRLDYHGGGQWSFVALTGRSFISANALAALADVALEQTGETPRAWLTARVRELEGLQADGEATVRHFERDRNKAIDELAAARAESERFARMGEAAVTAVRDAMQARLEGLQGAVERLSRERNDALAAAPDLPDVGPVTWLGLDREVLSVDGQHMTVSILDKHETEGLKRLARVHACRAFLDREAEERAAADTTTDDDDDEVEKLAAVLCEADDTNPYSFDGAGISLRCTYRDMARAALAHRSTTDTKD